MLKKTLIYIYLKSISPFLCIDFIDLGKIIQKFALTFYSFNSFNCFNCFKVPNESGSVLSLLLFKFSLIKDVRLPIDSGSENNVLELMLRYLRLDRSPMELGNVPIYIMF